jgi:hypothetical protein
MLSAQRLEAKLVKNKYLNDPKYDLAEYASVISRSTDNTSHYAQYAAMLNTAAAGQSTPEPNPQAQRGPAVPTPSLAVSLIQGESTARPLIVVACSLESLKTKSTCSVHLMTSRVMRSAEDQRSHHPCLWK